MPELPFRYRDEHGNIRLDELLGERHVRHYTRILKSSSEEFRAMQLSYVIEETPPDVQDAWAPVYERGRGTVTPEGWLLTPEGGPETAASSCRELALLPEVCWDVCGYYARAGVHWKASRAEIVRAQLERDPGRDDPELSYAIAQLLDPAVRRAYDMMPLGGLFMLDRGVRDLISRAAAIEASRRNAEAARNGEEYDEHARQRQVLGEWGFEKITDEEARERAADPFRAGDDPGSLGASLTAWEHRWGYYVLSDPYDSAPLPSAAVLEAWQAMIARALSEAGIRTSFAVGIWPGHGPKVLLDSNQSCIFFISRGETTPAKAYDAIHQYVALTHISEKRH